MTITGYFETTRLESELTAPEGTVVRHLKINGALRIKADGKWRFLNESEHKLLAELPDEIPELI